MKYKLYRIRIITVKVLVSVFFTLFIWLLLFVVNGLFERGAVNTLLNGFKERGIYDKTINIHEQQVDIYKVKKAFDYEDAETFIFDDSETSSYYIGSKTDIILTTRNPLRMYQTAILRDIAEIGAKYFFIGHGTINMEDDGSMVMECVGNEEDFNGVRLSEQRWVYTEVRYGNDAQIILGLRIKNITNETKENICTYLKTLEGKKYNYLLMFPSINRYYCTDLISRALKKEKINVNYDSFYTTGNDIIVSDYTYPIFLCERIKEGHFKIYYLSEE